MIIIFSQFLLQHRVNEPFCKAFHPWTIKFTKTQTFWSTYLFKNWSFAKLISFFVHYFLSGEKIWENWEKIGSLNKMMLNIIWPVKSNCDCSKRIQGKMKIGYPKFKLQIIPWTIPKKLNHDFAELIHSVKFYIRALLAMGISSQYIEHTKINDYSFCNSKKFEQQWINYPWIDLVHAKPWLLCPQLLKHLSGSKTQTAVALIEYCPLLHHE